MIENFQIESSSHSRYNVDAYNERWAHLRGLEPGQHSFEERSQRWRAVGDAVPDLTCPELNPDQPDSCVLNNSANVRLEYFK